MNDEDNKSQDLPEDEIIQEETSKVESDVSQTESEDTSSDKEVKSGFKYEETKPVRSERQDKDKKLDPHEVLNFLMQDPDSALKAIDRLKNDKLPGTKEEVERYLAHVAHSFGSHNQNSATNPFTELEEDSLWRQDVEHNESSIGANRPRLRQTSGKLSGESVDMRIRRAAGLGTMINVPLWHTGMWLKMKAPMESTLLELERRIAQDKMTLGRSTMGSSFSNTSVFLTYLLVDMILNHTYDGTFNEINPKSLKSVIKVTDIPTLIWGISSVIWPNGYPLAQPCVSNAVECSHVDEAHVNLTKLHWVNNRKLSQYQRNYMANPDRTVTSDDLTKYSDEHLAPQFTEVKISEDMSLKLKVPTILEHEASGFKWIDGIVETTDKAFGKDLRGNERDSYLEEQAQLSRLRKYSHWVDEIIFHDDDSSASDRDDIDRSLETISSSDEMYDKSIKGIESFIRSSVVAVVGIPRYTCPKCKGEPDPNDIPENLPEIIQLEVAEVFFILQSMRVQKMLETR